MTLLTNKETINKILQILILKIGRRTSNSYAVLTIDKVISNLTRKYNFLNCISIDSSLYSEGLEAVNISSEVDQINSDNIYDAVREIIKTSVNNIDGNQDYYFIKELEESFYEVDRNISQKIDFNMLQYEHIVERKDENKVIFNEIYERFTASLISALNINIPEKKAIEYVKKALDISKARYDVLKHLNIYEAEDSDGFISITADPIVNSFPSLIISNSLTAFLTNLYSIIDWDYDESFIRLFESEVDVDLKMNLERIGFKIDEKKFNIKKEQQDELVKNMLEALMKTMIEKSDQDFAFKTIDENLKNLCTNYETLRLIKMGNFTDSKDVAIFEINPKINELEPREVGKAIKDLIRNSGLTLKTKRDDFIDNFKAKLKKEEIEQISELGVNLHMLSIQIT
jgi:hypothetical protein